MPEMDGLTAMREHPRASPHWRQLPIIALTAKAMRDDQRAVPGGRRQRLHGQADRRRQAALAVPRLDAAMTEHRHRQDERVADVEFELLLEAIYRRYSLRLPPLRARLAAAAACTGACSVSAIATHVAAAGRACCTMPTLFPRLLALLYGAGQRHVPRPGVLRRAARRRAAAAAHLPVAQDLGRRLQHRRGGLLAGHPAATKRPARARDHLRHRHQPGGAAEGRGRRLRAGAGAGLHAKLPAAGGTGSLSDYYTAAYDRVAVRSTAAQPRRRSPTTASPPTPSSPRCSWSRAATC